MNDLLRDFSVGNVSPEDAAQILQQTLEGTSGAQTLQKQIIPVVDDIFISLFSGGRDPQKDPAAIMWRHILSGRSARIRRPFHVAWAMLRRLSQVNPIIGMCVRFFMQEFRTLNWDVVPLKSEYKKTAAVAKMLLRFPNPMDTWHTFMDKLLIELLTLDAAPIEIWYGRYIPFNIAYERAKLNKLEKMYEKVASKKNTPDYYEISTALTNSAMRLSLLQGVQEERIRLLAQLGKETEVLAEYSRLHEQAERLHKALLQLGGSGLSDSNEFHNYLAEHLEKQRDNLDSPLDLPIALLVTPGDQIEVWGDIELGMMDFDYPYRRVLFERIVGKYRRDHMIYLREFNRADSFYGLSPVEGVLLVAYTYLVAHDVQFRYFTRSNIPAGLLIFPGAVNVDTVRRRLREMLVSPERIAIITTPPGGQAPQWVALSNVNREIQFTELINWYVRLIILSFGLQPWEIGVESGSVNKRQLRVRPGIMGRMRFIESALNDMLIVRCFKADPSGIQFKFYGIDVGDFAEEANVLNNIVFKLITLDEARARLGLPPLENGLSDYLFFPMGGQMFFIAKKKAVLDEEVEYDTPEKVVGMWSAIAGGMPKGLEAAGGGVFPAGPALLKAQELRKRGLVDDSVVADIERGLSEKQRSALKWFAKSMCALGVFNSPQEGYKFAFTVYKEMSERLARSPSWFEWASELGGYLMDAYNQRLAKDVRALLAGSVDVTDELLP